MNNVDTLASTLFPEPLTIKVPMNDTPRKR